MASPAPACCNDVTPLAVNPMPMPIMLMAAVVVSCGAASNDSANRSLSGPTRAKGC
jgi:hypothetical protein